MEVGRMKRAPRKKPPEPFRFMRTPELAEAMNLSEDAIRALRDWGAPFISLKSHPEILFDWIKQNPGKIGKLE
jgi:hypothetical protein